MAALRKFFCMRGIARERPVRGAGNGNRTRTVCREVDNVRKKHEEVVQTKRDYEAAQREQIDDWQQTSKRKKMKEEKNHGWEETEEDERKLTDGKKKKKSIRVGLLNVRSLNNKTDTVREVIKKNQLDVFLTTETWLESNTKTVLTQASPENFRYIGQLREDKTRGGVAIQFREELREERIRMINISTFEYVAAALRCDDWDQPILIINLYLPPGYDEDESQHFLREFKELMEEVTKQYSSIILKGHFNIKYDLDEQSFNDEFNHLLQHYNLEQHVKNKRGNTLDLVLSRNVEIYDLRVDPNAEIRTDHYPIYLEVNPKPADTSEESDGREETEEDESKQTDGRKKTKCGGKTTTQRTNPDQHQTTGSIINRKNNQESETQQKPPEFIRVGMLNVQSFNNKTDTVRRLITQNQLDVFLTTETWLKPDTAERVLTKASPPNFGFICQVRKDRRGGGVAIQFREELQQERVRIINIRTFECVAAALRHDDWNQPILIINLYLPPGYDEEEFQKFLKEFEQLMKQATKEYSSIIMTGDFNIKYGPDSGTFTDELYDHVPSYNLKQYIHKQTLERGDTLDLFHTEHVKISDVRVHRIPRIKTDHFPIYFNAKPKPADTSVRSETKSISMALLNVHSLNNKTDTVREFITGKQLDVFLPTETWLKPDTEETVLTEASPPNFRNFSQVREDKPRGGVAIQFREELQGQRVWSDNIRTFEYVATVLSRGNWDQPILIINLYLPPGCNNKKFRKFLDEFEELMKQATKEWSSIIVTGDFNIKVDPQRRSFTDEFYHLLRLYGLEQHVDEPTHEGGNILDLVLSRNVEISDLIVDPNPEINTDHYTIYFNAKPKPADTSVRSETKPISMALLNVHSLHNKTDTVREFITGKQLDVFLTTETWLTSETEETVLTEASPENFRNFSQVRSEHNDKTRGGGVAIQFKKELQGERVEFKNTTAFEYVAAVLRRDDWNQWILSINLYLPPGYDKEKFKDFLDEFEKLMEQVTKKYSSIIVTGDFNIKNGPNSGTYTDDFYKLLDRHNLKQHVDEPTHERGNILDLVLSRNVEISGLWVDPNAGIRTDLYLHYFNAKPADTSEETEEDEDEEQAQQAGGIETVRINSRLTDLTNSMKCFSF